jgi:succinate dehydrogenase/fumarate reductase cytochrome b subunit
MSSFLQVVGAGCLVLVALTHICEALHILPGMRWGYKDSAGHYLDLASAALGVTLFPLGYVWGNLRAKSTSR